MTPVMYNTHYFFPNVWYMQKNLYYSSVSTLNIFIRPIINVTVDGDFTSGDGSVKSPYVIEG